MHPLLLRQLTRVGLDPEHCPPDVQVWQAVLERISQSYTEGDQGRALLERSLDVASREMQGLYEELRRSSETRLRQEYDKFQAIIEALHDGLCLLDLEARVVFINPQGVLLLGQSGDAIIGRHILELMLLPLAQDPARPGVMPSLSELCGPNQTLRSDEGAIHRPDNTIVPTACTFNPIWQGGTLTSAVLMFRDITDAKQREEVRHQTEKFLRRQQAALTGLTKGPVIYSGNRSIAFRRITESAAHTLNLERVSIWLFPEDRATLRCADLFKRNLGVHSGGHELIVASYPDYFRELFAEQIIAADDAHAYPATREFAASYPQPLGVSSVLHVPIQWRSRLVGVLCLEHTGPPRKWTTEEQQFAASLANLVALSMEAAERAQAEHALRTSEERLALTVTGTHIGIWDWDPQSNAVYFSPEWKRQLGYEDEEIVERFSEWESRLHPDDHDGALAALHAYLANPTSAFEFEYRLRHKNGSYRWILARSALVKNEAALAIRVTGIQIDVTERKAAEDELRRAKEAAEAANVAKSQFLANMSHEIRTPMNGVLGIAALLMETSLTPKQQQLAETMVRSGTSLIEIINDILDFSKIEAGKLELESTDFHLRLLLEEVLELFGAPAHSKQVELIGEISESVPSFVKGDSGRLRQILMNLIGNAVKFTSHGEIVAAVDCLAGGEDQSMLRFSVKDTGIGIAPDSLRTIFQPFSQADGSMARKYGGTGLGLAIVKQLVVFMGGDIWVESRSGEGSTFFFTVRLRSSQLGRSGALLANQALHNHRILVVDDNATLRVSLARQLRGWGMSPTLAASGQEALQLFSKAVDEGAPFDSVILDLGMPHMNGLQTIQAMGETGRLGQTRVILMGPVHWPETTDASSNLVTTTLTKPVKLSELHRILSGAEVTPVAFHPTRTPIASTLSPSSKRPDIVLLAEDNAVNQEVTLGMLEILGFAAVTVENGKQAIDMIQQQPFSLVLMDCQMPEMDGFAATRFIRRREESLGTRVPIIALTANALQGDKELCLAAGMDDYVSKPFTLDQLRQVFHRWLPTPSASQAPPSALTETARAASHTQPAAIQADSTESSVDPHAWAGILALQRPGQPDILAKIMTLYLKDSQDVVDKIGRAVMERNARLLQESAHSLKSRSAALGAHRLAELCKQLEQAGRSQTLDDHTASVVSTLNAIFAETCRVLQRELAKRAA